MPLVVIDDSLVIELRGADAKTVVGIRGSQKKPVMFEEGAHNIAVPGRCLAENSLFWIGVEPARKLLEHATLNQLLEMPIDRRRPAGQVLAAIYVTRFQMLFEFFKLCHARNISWKRPFCKISH